MSKGYTNSHDQHIELWVTLNHLPKLFPCFVPIVESIVHFEVLIIWIKKSLSFHDKFALFLQVILYLLPLVSPDVNRIAALATAKLAPICWQSCSSLHSWNLAKTALSCFTESSHALTATTIFHDKLCAILCYLTPHTVFSIITILTCVLDLILISESRTLRLNFVFTILSLILICLWRLTLRRTLYLSSNLTTLNCFIRVLGASHEHLIVRLIVISVI